MTDTSYIEHRESGHSFVGQDAVDVFAAYSIASALRFTAKTGMQVNRAYTRKAMLAKAAQITGNTYKRTELVRAADDLTEWAHAKRATIPERTVQS